MVVDQRLGIEPAWVTSISSLAGIAIRPRLSCFGTAIIRGCKPWTTGLLLATALPLGVSIDWLIGALLPAGLFLSAAGFSIGLPQFGASFTRLALHAPQPSNS